MHIVLCIEGEYYTVYAMVYDHIPYGVHIVVCRFFWYILLHVYMKCIYY